MKVTYLERIENHISFFGKMICSACGAHEYDIVEQLEPQVEDKWFVRCPQCGYETEPAPSRELAIIQWK